MRRVSMIFRSENTTTPLGGVFSIELYNAIEKQYQTGQPKCGLAARMVPPTPTIRSCRAKKPCRSDHAGTTCVYLFFASAPTIDTESQ